jgi:serine protease Do
MQWRHLIARPWPILAVAVIGLLGVAALAHAAGNPIFFQTNDNEETDASGWLGVYLDDISQDLARDEGLLSTDGVYISGVVDDSPAEEAGLKEGDVIVKYDGRDVRSVRRLTRMIEDTKPYTKVDIEILRDDKPHVLVCEIGADENGSAWSWNFSAPHLSAPRAPRAPDAPDTPRPPRAYSFSLGQLSSSYIGVGLYDMSDQLAAALGATDGGALINEVEKDSPAEKAGLQAGDVIVEIDHKKIDETDDVRRAIQQKKDGDVVTIRVLRGKNEDKTVDVTVEGNDTWSGIGFPRSFHMLPGNTGNYEWREDLDDLKEKMRESGDEWREELQEQMRELREQMRELREELRDNR